MTLVVLETLWPSVKAQKGNNMGNTTKLKIDGMTCLNCVTHIQKALEAVPGVSNVTVTQGEGATVDHTGTDGQQLIAAVRAAGDYKAEVMR